MGSAKRLVGAVTTTLAVVTGSLASQASAPDVASAAAPMTYTIMAYPSDDLLRQDQIGDTMTMALVQGTVSKNADGTFDVAPTRSSVPQRAISSSRVVNFYIQVVEADGTISETAFPLVEDPTSGNGWIDAGWTFEATKVRQQMARGVHRSRHFQRLASRGMTSVTVAMVNHPATSEDDDADLNGRWTALVNSDVVRPVVRRRGGSGAANCDLYAQDPVSTTVATSYPIQGDDSWLTYSSSEHTTTGIGVTNGTAGSFHASGTKSTDDEWGANFPKSSRNRSYRVDINYGLYHCTNVITGYRWNQVAPRFQTGGVGQNILDPSDRPDWNNHDWCPNITAPDVEWWRGQTRGSDYSLSYGVKIASAIGIDLSSRHVYSSGTRLYYHVTRGNKEICGSNNVPTRAAKMIERVR